MKEVRGSGEISRRARFGIEWEPLEPDQPHAGANPAYRIPTPLV